MAIAIRMGFIACCLSIRIMSGRNAALDRQGQAVDGFGPYQVPPLDDRPARPGPGMKGRRCIPHRQARVSKSSAAVFFGQAVRSRASHDPPPIGFLLPVPTFAPVRTAGLPTRPSSPAGRLRDPSATRGVSMRIIVSALVASVFLTACVSGSGSESHPPNYVATQTAQAPAIRNDTFGGAAMPMRGLPR
jgi:hypothetical protein